MATAMVVALLMMPLKAEGPEFDWTTVHRQVSDLLQRRALAESEKVLEEAINAARKRGEISAGLAEVLNDLGSLYHDAGRFAEAERAYRESLSIWKRVDVTNPKKAITLENLAGLRLAQRRPSDAEKLYLEAARLVASRYGLNGAENARVFCGLADTYLELGKYEEARLLGERALSILETAAMDPELGIALFILAKTAWKQNRDGETERLLRRANEIWRTSLGPQHPTFASGLVSLAVLMSRKNPSEADRLFSEGLQSIETQLGSDHVFRGYALVLYARHLEDQGRKGEGKRLKRQGEEIVARHSHENLLGHTLDVQAFQRRNPR